MQKRSLMLDEVSDIIIKTVEKAHREYHKMSGGYWLSQAPEYFTTTRLAQALKSHTNITYIDLEYNVRDAMNICGARQRGRPKKSLRINGRFDLMLWGKRIDNDGANLPLAPIEVKVRAWQKKNICSDFSRLAQALRGNSASSLEFSMLALYLSDGDGKLMKGWQKIENAIGRLVKVARNEAEATGRYKIVEQFGKIKKTEGGAWAAGVIAFQRTHRTS